MNHYYFVACLNKFVFLTKPNATFDSHNRIANLSYVVHSPSSTENAIICVAYFSAPNSIITSSSLRHSAYSISCKCRWIKLPIFVSPRVFTEAINSVRPHHEAPDAFLLSTPPRVSCCIRLHSHLKRCDLTWPKQDKLLETQPVLDNWMCTGLKLEALELHEFVEPCELIQLFSYPAFSRPFPSVEPLSDELIHRLE